MSLSFIQRRFVARLLQINDTPEAVALGAAVGMFIAWTPTVGLQMVLMIIVGTFIRANRLAGVVMVYLSNPFTVLPIYFVDYWIGSSILGHRLMSYEQFGDQWSLFVSRWDTDGLWRALGEFMEAHGDTASATMLGGAMIGLLLALPTYPVVLRLVRAQRRHKLKKRLLEGDSLDPDPGAPDLETPDPELFGVVDPAENLPSSHTPGERP